MKTEKKRIAVIFGGCSPEHDVSLESAAAVIENIDRERFMPICIGITSEGEWRLCRDDAAAIRSGEWGGEESAECCLSPDRRAHELLVLRGDRAERIKLDAVFPVLHGKNGEDGTLQGICELAGIPLVGCGTLASAICMDKYRAHELAARAGVAVPRSFTVGGGYDATALRERAAKLGYPLFIKPSRAGSSFGISEIFSEDELDGAVEGALLYDDTVVIEETIEGFEVGCAVMGEGESLVFGEPDEVELCGGFFDFDEKYKLITSRIHVPARVPAAVRERIKGTAGVIYRALDCRGFARVDMFLTPGGRIVFNEVNTIPGFTEHSRFPGMMRAAEISFSDVITRVIEAAR